jgi:large subunit ribosomal protein L31e
MPEPTENERIYVIPLRKCINVPRVKRAPCAIKYIRKFVARHMNAPERNVWIDPPVSEAIWRRGIQKPPNRIRVKVVKFEEDNLVEVSLPEE